MRGALLWEGESVHVFYCRTFHFPSLKKEQFCIRPETGERSVNETMHKQPQENGPVPPLHSHPPSSLSYSVKLPLACSTSDPINHAFLASTGRLESG